VKELEASRQQKGVAFVLGVESTDHIRASKELVQKPLVTSLSFTSDSKAEDLLEESNDVDLPHRQVETEEFLVSAEGEQSAEHRTFLAGLRVVQLLQAEFYLGCQLVHFVTDHPSIVVRDLGNLLLPAMSHALDLLKCIWEEVVQPGEFFCEDFSVVQSPLGYRRRQGELFVRGNRDWLVRGCGRGEKMGRQALAA